MHNYRLLSVFSKIVIYFIALDIFSASAVVNIDRTRIIFDGKKNTEIINLVNDGHNPAVVQVWTDDGDISVTPDQSKTPIISLPPVMKLLPGELRSLRLLLTTRSKIAGSKESLYWLNIYQIPALRKESVENGQHVILPLRIRLKVFVRPEGLAKPDYSSPEILHFSGVGKKISITNPTNWYVSINRVKIKGGEIKSKTVPPKSKIEISFPGVVSAGDEVCYDLINDDGNVVSFKSRVDVY